MVFALAPGRHVEYAPARNESHCDIRQQSCHLTHCPMSIKLQDQVRKDAIASIERYFRENMDERIGNIAASGLLSFFLEEVGPIIYNQAVADVQERLQMRISELDIEVHEDEFQYWRKFERPGKGRR